METSKFARIGVVGAGQMGSGIAQTCAMHGFAVVLTDAGQTALDRSRSGISDSLARLAKKGALAAEEPAKVLARIQWGQNLEAHGSCDLVIEAIVENFEAKQKLFTDLDRIVGPHCILASNTSSIPITQLAATTRRPGQVLGMHFMNPVPIMKLVEIIEGLATDPVVTARIVDLATALGKTTIRSKDFPGFVVNRVLMPLINESFDALLQGVASAEDIDTGVRLGLNHPMGPLSLADLIGLDTCLSILETLHSGLGDPRYRPSPLLRQYVAAGRLGRKTGHGVYAYPK